MRVTTVIRAMALLALLAGTAAAGVKYVAVVETDVDASSGASEELKPAEVREITAELRRQATENLPRDKYSVMTSETVQSMGGAVLEECAEENCVIALGSKIGADYIVRGTVSKFQTMFTLGIELYETENGTLVVSSEAVRSENLVELLKMTATASGNMFRKFAGGKVVARKSKTDTDSRHDGDNAITSNKKCYNVLQYQFPVGTPVSWGGVHVEDRTIWRNGVSFGMEFGGGVGGPIRDGSPDNVFVGIGLSLGKVYDLWDQLQFAYGGSVGFWFVGTQINSFETSAAFNYLAPFVKLRWNFVELAYKGLFGLRHDWHHEGSQVTIHPTIKYCTLSRRIRYRWRFKERFNFFRHTL